MSFTTDVASELLDAALPRTCCRKAILYGMLFGAEVCGPNSIRAEFKTQQSAQKAAQIFNGQFSVSAQITQTTRAGRPLFVLEAKSKAIASFLTDIDLNSQSKALPELVGFRCAECSHSFLRGVFIAAGTVNDPRRGYHLEISIKNTSRAKLLSDFLESEGISPKMLTRGNKVGLYYKSNSAISDLIYYMGGVNSSFDLANACIERDIRNSENRATNCVTRNISRSVEASMKQIEAIQQMKSKGELSKLSEELRYTAELRLENPSASLSELAMLHQPPISKSGLNRRIVKIIEKSKEK